MVISSNTEENDTKKIDLSSIKSVRVICNDPYATESSSEDESISDNNLCRSIKPKRTKPLKRYVSEICVQTLIERSNSSSEKLTGNRKSLSGFKGVRQRPWGKFAAEIRDPFQKKRKWLGTFPTVEEAAEAYQKSKIEFEEQLGLVNQPGLVIPEVDVVDLTKPCEKEVDLTKPCFVKPKEVKIDLTKPCGLSKWEEKEPYLVKPEEVKTKSCGLSKPEEKETNGKIFGFGCDDDDEEEGTICRMLEDPIMTSSISDIFGDMIVEPNDLWLDYNNKLELNSIFDDGKFDFVEEDNQNGQMVSSIKSSKKNGNHTKAVENSEIESTIANIVDGWIDFSMDLEFDLILDDDFELDDFSIDDFEGLEMADDDDSWFIGTIDWID